MGVSSCGRWGAVAAVLSMVCSLAVAPSAWAGSPDASSASDGAGGSSKWPAGVPDPSSWLRNVKVSDVGAHTADVSFDWDLSYLLNGKQSGSYKDRWGGNSNWKVDYVSGGLLDYGSSSYGTSVDPAKDIDGVCFAIGVGRATSVVPSEGYVPLYYEWCGDSDPTSPDSSVADDKMTPEDYQRIHGTHTETVWNTTVTGQGFTRSEHPSLAEAGAKPGTLKGHYDMALIGLEANTLYGNTKDTVDHSWGLNSYYEAVASTASGLSIKGVRKATKVDIRSLRLGVALHLKDSSKAVQQCKANKDTTNKSGCNIVFPLVDASEMGFATAAVPDFRTGVEPGVVSSASELPGSAKDRLKAASNAVKQGSVARFYVDGLKAAARGKADASSLFWYAYVYSSPQRLTGPDGSPYVTVKKSSDGRYYFDAIVPAGLKTGSHTVSLVDAKGVCQGWTPVTVTASDTVTMWRLYNPNSGEHFYTGNTAERDHLVHVGWKSEGVGWTAPVKGDPVYRLYNPNAGDHHYTLNPAERDMLVRAGWKYEGIGWYSASASVTGRKPLYRQYNPNARAGAHNYTLSKAENDHLVCVGWRAEGLAWYAVS